MTATAARPARRGGLALALFALAAAIVAAFFFLGRAIPLERSAIGFDGLAPWLAESGMEIVPVLPAQDAADDDWTLRVLPVFDADIEGVYTHDGYEDSRGSLQPRGMSAETVESKLAGATTLVILPKWRDGVVDRARLHPDLLMEANQIWFFTADAVARPDGASFTPIEILGTSSDTPPQETMLYAPQVLGAGLDAVCEPIWELRGGGTLLAWCDGFTPRGASAYVLSDPDLLDNHGLGLGANAQLATALFAQIAPGSVYMDDGAPEEGEDWDTPPGADTRGRSFSDLGRLFDYPYALAWLGALGATLLVLWRGNVRFGAPLADDDGRGMRSREDAIRASGGLMRRAGNESELVLAHARARIAHLGEVLLGSRARRKGEESALPGVLRHLSRRAPALGARLEKTHGDLVVAGLDTTARLDALPPFEAVFEEILDEFGRAARPS